jgi:MerR family redox-sensitive transcriptional activator SoxR
MTSERVTQVARLVTPERVHCSQKHHGREGAMKMIPIGQVAKRAGIAASAIRYYESEGLLPPALREGGRRVYDEPVLDRLSFIELAKKSGFTVAEIRKLQSGFARSAPPGVRWRALAEKKMREIEQRIAEAQQMKELLGVVMGCECPEFEDCARAMRDGGAPCSKPSGCA